MPEEVLFKTEATVSRDEIADALADAAEQVRSGTVTLESATDEQTVELPAEPTFEMELERITDSETGEEYYELEYEMSWTE
ncbi:MAG: amphi-Trp domain-containing protein [Halobacteriales archaeon]|nr:amphi-Trp domain-containing protein [Halobacteriales archaeon]